MSSLTDAGGRSPHTCTRWQLACTQMEQTYGRSLHWKKSNKSRCCADRGRLRRGGPDHLPDEPLEAGLVWVLLCPKTSRNRKKRRSSAEHTKGGRSESYGGADAEGHPDVSVLLATTMRTSRRSRRPHQRSAFRIGERGKARSTYVGPEHGHFDIPDHRGIGDCEQAATRNTYKIVCWSGGGVFSLCRVASSDIAQSTTKDRVLNRLHVRMRTDMWEKTFFRMLRLIQQSCPALGSERAERRK